MIYQPAEDSYLVLKHIKKYAKGKVLDMGSGSGILAKEALKYTKEVLAADVNIESIKDIKHVKSDLFSNIKEKLDLIIFNPPYLPKDKYDKEKDTTGGKKGNETIIRFLKDAKKFLNKNGKILLIYSSLTPKMPELINKYNFKYKILDQKSFFFETIYLVLITTNTFLNT